LSNVPIGPEELIERFENAPTKAVLSKALLWIAENLEDDLVEDVCEAAILSNAHFNWYEWAENLFRTQPKSALSIGQVVMRHQSIDKVATLAEICSQLVLEEKKLNEDDRILLACDLMNANKQAMLMPFAEKWLAKNHGAKLEPIVLRALLIIDPSEAHLTAATSWYWKNSSDWYSNLVLASLIEIDKNDKLIDETLRKIETAADTDYEVLLLIAPLIRIAPKSVEWLKRWLAQNDCHPLAGEILCDCFREKPELFVDSVILWLTDNDKNSDAVCEELVAWIEENETNSPIVERLLPYLTNFNH